MANPALHKIHLFQGLSEAGLSRVAAYLKPRTYAPGEIIFYINDPGEEVFFIETGMVVVFDPAASSVAVRTFTDGSLFGELAVIDHKPRTLSARAETDCRLWVLPADKFEQVILEDKKLVMEMLVRLSASIRYTTDIFMDAIHRSIHDALTGLYNRNLFESMIMVLEEGRRSELSVILIDIDGLKQVNDTQGHEAGDRLICQAAGVLRSAFRAEDAVARIGGDEFAVLLPGVNAAGAQEATTRVLARLEAHNREHPDFPVSFSLGAATGDPGIPIQNIVKQADKRMYEHKVARKKQRVD